MKRIIAILIIAYLWTGFLQAQDLDRKVLIIGIDGCRPDALQVAATPHIDSLIANATYSMDALTRIPTMSGPGWSSLLTGVWGDKHGVTDNSFSGSNYGEYPHFFNRIEEYDSAMVTASIAHWSPINNEIVDLADFQYNASTDAEVASVASNYLLTNDPDVLFLHFDDVDGAGHGNGYHPTIPAYVSAIETVDVHVGTVLTGLASRTTYGQEDWVVILSTDHGGLRTGHGGPTPEERTIFVIGSGDQVPNQEISKELTGMVLPSSALSFDGVDDYAVLGQSPVFDFGSLTDFTVECLVKTSGWVGDPAIISNKDWNSGSNPGFVLAAYWDTPPIKRWKVNLGDGSNRADLFGGQLDDGRWHHLAVTCDRDGEMKLYQDGFFIRSANISSIGNINTGLDLVLGQDGTLSYPSFYSGLIDEVRIWSAVLDQEELERWACSSVDVSHPDYSQLVGYWKCDEAAGTAIGDSSPNGNSGTLMGASWTMPASQYACYSFLHSPRIVDVALTALKHLCIPIQPVWNLDGQPVGVSCRPRTPKRLFHQPRS